MNNACEVELSLRGSLNGLRLLVHAQGDQHVSRHVLEHGVWEPFETKLLAERLQEGAVFVDVGANIGYFSQMAAALVGNTGHVFAFEPDASNFSLLHSSTALNGFQSRVTAVQAALSDHAGSAELFLSDSNFGDHQLHADDPGRRSVTVELLNGSDYLASKTDAVDLLKIDVQGAELQVMKGLMPLIKSLAKCPEILIELTPFSLQRAGASGRELIELLSELPMNFQIVDHIEHELVASSSYELALWCDNVDSSPGDRGFMNIMLTDPARDADRR